MKGNSHLNNHTKYIVIFFLFQRPRDTSVITAISTRVLGPLLNKLIRNQSNNSGSGTMTPIKSATHLSKLVGIDVRYEILVIGANYNKMKYTFKLASCGERQDIQ